MAGFSYLELPIASTRHGKFVLPFVEVELVEFVTKDELTRHVTPSDAIGLTGG
jgi:hypothetical protein